MPDALTSSPPHLSNHWRVGWLDDFCAHYSTEVSQSNSTIPVSGLFSGILYFIIVRELRISGTIAARGLKFWLQVALSAPIATAWTEIRKSGFSGNFFFAFFASTDSPWPPDRPLMVPDPSGYPDPGNPDFPDFFVLFSLLLASWDLRVTSRMVQNHQIRIRTRKSGFSKIRIFPLSEKLKFPEINKVNSWILTKSSILI